MPRMNSRWKTMNTSRIGTATITAPADTSETSVVYRPEKLARPAGAVDLFTVNTSARKTPLELSVIVRPMRVGIGGRASGAIIRQRGVRVFAPGNRGASSKDGGDERDAARIEKM